MARRCVKSLFLCLLTAFFISTPPLTFADNTLPDIGTAGVSALSIDQEIAYGGAFMRMARAGLPIVDDPVLNEYINDLGSRLVNQAENVRFPFTFFFVKDDSINAAAFLGGKVKVHTGLLLYTENENELAGVLAHEISHVTQRHIARYMEDNSKSTPLSIAGLVGSIALAMVNPTAGIAALNATVGLTIQNSINFTRENEYEADRIGIGLLYRAGFDPNGMVSFFQKLNEQSRYATSVPEMLLTHPLTEKRIAEAKNRANSFHVRKVASSLDFYLAKSRIEVLYSPLTAESRLAFYQEQLGKLKPKSNAWLAADYGKALALMNLHREAEALPVMNELLKIQPDNLFFNDSLTDLQISMKAYDAAIHRLTTMQKESSDNPVVIMNLANAYLKADQPEKTIQVLDEFTRNNKESTTAWELISEAYQRTNNLPGYYQAQAEYNALLDKFEQAKEQLHMARANTSDAYSQARIDARIAELESLKKVEDTMRR